MPEPEQRTRRPTVEVRRPAVRIGLGLGADSCMRTGMHRIDVRPALPGVPTTRSVEGVCRTCGLVKRYPTTAAGAAAKKRAQAKKSWQPPDLTAIPPIGMSDVGVWVPAFDALSHLGRGTPSAISRILTQMDGSPLGVDVLVRGLESLGHVDLIRDPRTLEVLEWEMTPPTLVGTRPDHWVLVGRRTVSQFRQLVELATYVNGQVDEALDYQVPRLEITLSDAKLAEVVDVLNDDWPELVVVHDAARRLAAGLPPLSAIARGLARTPVPAITGIETWNTQAGLGNLVARLRRLGPTG